MTTQDDTTPQVPSKAFDGAAAYRSARAHFVRSGTTFNKWCLENGISRTYAEKSIKGERNGPKARAIREQVMRALGISHD